MQKLTDAFLVGPGVPLALERTYRSDSTAAGLLGRDWATPFDSKLAVATYASGKLASVWPDRPLPPPSRVPTSPTITTPAATRSPRSWTVRSPAGPSGTPTHPCRSSPPSTTAPGPSSSPTATTPSASPQPPKPAGSFA
uniref:DUF6531 domain-containing protein n=1 Tax=Streptomyces sp. JV181 TaxID=858635 RepID=UPI003FA7B1AC